MKILSTLAMAALLTATACSSGVHVTSPSRPAPVSAPRFAPVAVTASITLSSAQVAAIRAHYSESSRGNGRGRSGGLPPGIARNLERGKPLPPGIAKQYLPQDLVVTLPRPTDGLGYVVAAGKLLLIEVATEIVREVLIDALFD